MKQRMQLVEAWRRGEASIAELARRFGVSRKAAYKWIARASEDGGEERFADRSRRPRRSPTAIEAWVVDAIVRSRKLRPTWGPRKVRSVLQAANPRVKLPAVSTFAAIFKRHGLVRPKRKRTRTPPFSAPLAHAKAPNDLWCIDFKGHFAVGRGRCYPLTITDAYSRYVIACVALRNPTSSSVRREMERVFREFGLPRAIRSDNGEPFASVAVAGLSKLSAWWLKLGISHERIRPGHPEENGRHERMHLTLKQETATPPAPTLAVQQRRFDLWRAIFNDQRPHEALGMRPPAQFYTVSSRCLPEPPWGRDFDYDLVVEPIRVTRTGRVRSALGSFFLSAALRHELVGLEWSSAGHWRVMFGPLVLGQLHRVRSKRRRVRFVPVAEVSPMSSDKASPMSVE